MHLLAFTCKPYIDGDYALFCGIILLMYDFTIVLFNSMGFTSLSHGMIIIILTQVFSFYPIENAKYSPNGVNTYSETTKPLSYPDCIKYPPNLGCK